MRRETQNILLILLGGALLKIALNGDYLRYVKPSQQPWVIAGGAAMVLLGGIAVVRDVLAARRAEPAGVPGDDCHDHPARSAWLLMVPVLAVFLVAPPALGADSVARNEARAPEVTRGASFPPLPPGEVVPLAVSQFVTRAGWDAAGTLNGRTVSMTGFVVRDGRDVLLARMVISCCAADAFPVTVRLTGEPRAAELPVDTWIEVTGQYVPGPQQRRPGHAPELAVTTLRETPAPPDPYEY
ncbi:TIGR03943 family putative permease subunit [Qaidamihabitans albus]|uniref:TIGR03943 family putative permease subunit n=1 Tax=Qaidamihabitans albus TaxID=2795733 RepID=UPI0018F12A37|nr:TIGR03943 family protein [Qaidamihabitans albus]